MKKQFKKIVLVLLTAILFPFSLSASTVVSSSTLDVNTTWTKAESPYLVNSPLYVTASSTLVIEPGAIVKFGQGASLTIAGGLDAVGSSANKIYFTSINDNSVGGRTGTGNPSAGDWGGISFIESPITFSLRNIMVRYSNSGFFLLHSFGDFQNVQFATSSGVLTLNGSQLSVNNSQFQNISGAAFTSYGSSTLSFNNSSLENSSGGFSVYNSSALTLGSSSINNINGISAFLVFNDSKATISSSTIQNINPTSYQGSITAYDNGGLSISNSKLSNLNGLSALLIYRNESSEANLTNSLVDKGLADGLMIYNDSKINISSSTISHFKNNGIEEFLNGQVNLTNSQIINNGTGLSFADPSLVVSTSSIQENNNGLIYTGSPSLLAQNIWWGDQSGPFNQSSNPSGSGNQVSDNVLYSPWLSTDPFAGAATSTASITSGSNVLFLPGLEASRLYNRGLLTENQLWEPNRNADADKLKMDSHGEALDQSIYTRDIINKTNVGFGIFDKDVYQKFSDFMNTLVTGGTINAWEAVPYDWRRDYNDLIVNGIKLANNQYISLPDEIDRLASSSKSHQVTIVAHSNGGLLAKALIDFLKKKNKAGLVDRLVMVASPELGTPQVIGGLLHGDEQNLPIGLSKSTARSLGENMPAAYNLLPNQKYFNKTNTPVVQFDASVNKINNFRKIYGNNINNLSNLSSFLLAKDGRSKPSEFDISDPNVLNPGLLSSAKTVHSQLDNWTPPTGLQVVEVAGWGINTTNGLEYLGKEHCLLAIIPCSYELDHQLIKTMDGDGTVVSDSVSETGTKLYMNVRDYNSNNKQNASHAFLLETKPVEELIANLIKGTSSLPSYISLNKPTSNNSSNLEISVHSPVSIDAYDAFGNHTGLTSSSSPSTDLQFTEENIPNSSYQENGEGKYLDLPDGDYRFKLSGLDVGSFTLEERKFDGDTQIIDNLFADLPVTPMTSAELVISSTSSPSSPPVLLIDEDGDGIIDASSTASTEIDPAYYLTLIRKLVLSLDISENLRSKILNKIDDLLKLINKGKIKNATKKIKAFNATLEAKMSKHGKHQKISKADAQALIDLLNQLLDSLNSNS